MQVIYLYDLSIYSVILLNWLYCRCLITSHLGGKAVFKAVNGRIELNVTRGVFSGVRVDIEKTILIYEKNDLLQRNTFIRKY